nr:hypothetical protein [uncultured Mucilaginibacter sp.]
MSLQKTVIYPNQNPSGVIAQPILKFVVLGNHPALVTNADQLAQHPVGINRAVIWFRTLPGNLNHYFHGVPADLGNVIAFSCSTLNKVADIIYANEDADLLRIMEAYTNAGLAEYN